MITDNLEELKREFIRIKKMGYVKSTRGGTTGIGKTFEDLLGKNEDTLDIPDYKGIEIKTKRGYSKAYITLFNATPKGKDDFEIQRLVQKYGAFDKILKNKKVLNTSVQGNASTFVTNRYLFKLQVDYENEKVFLSICDKNMMFVEHQTYWDFDTLEQRFYKKLNYLALIKAWPKMIDGIDYYKYYDINFYKRKDFKDFLSLLQDGTIRITFKIGVYRRGDKKGAIYDHGTSFQIQELDLLKLFDLIKV